MSSSLILPCSVSNQLTQPQLSPLASRRNFLKGAAIIPAMALLPPMAQADDFWNLPRELWLKRTQTGEEVRAIYWADGRLVPEGYHQICRLMRDVKAGRAVQMGIVLLDVLRGIYGWFEAHGVHKPLMINSGYRTDHTNTMTEGAARNSMHTLGKAADIWIPGVPTSYLANLGVYLAGGGVGYYARKNMVHVDEGRFRYWAG